ncbi:hypothetical protein [Sulfolobus tengchongensis spindle-shaped virus 4]|nr:hypothetical protein [Sulfolobus tengchongensis spindle-shaped virus 4]
MIACSISFVLLVYDFNWFNMLIASLRLPDDSAFCRFVVRLCSPPLTCCCTVCLSWATVLASLLK